MEPVLEQTITYSAHHNMTRAGNAKSYEQLYTKMDEITKDAQEKGVNSAYSPYKNRKLVLIFPKCFNNKISDGQVPNIAVRLGSLEKSNMR